MKLHKNGCRLRSNICALAQHLMNTRHNINFQRDKNLEILKNNYKMGIVLEMCYIIKTTIGNLESDTNDLEEKSIKCDYAHTSDFSCSTLTFGCSYKSKLKKNLNF